LVVVFSFFFQAEDGIRDDLVTGVQTCALPISGGEAGGAAADQRLLDVRAGGLERGKRAEDQAADGGRREREQHGRAVDPDIANRSEERRVGKGGRSRWATDDEQKERGTHRERK